MIVVALLAEGVDRNLATALIICSSISSPSSRRAWIEIDNAAAQHNQQGGRPPRGGRG